MYTSNSGFAHISLLFKLFRIKPQNDLGFKVLWTAVNFHPMCVPQFTHMAIVQAYL